MSLAVDTAWHKRGFDSLTSHTFFMGKSCYGKKVVKQSLNIVHVELASGGQDMVQTYQCALTDV